MIKRKFALACAISAYALMSQIAFAQSPSRPATATTDVSPSADNTKSNKYESTPTTADAQKNDATDMDLAQRIRKSVMADKTLSTYAHNVKIVAVGGKVTLNGVVRSKEEKDAIQMKAVQIAGKTSVVNDLSVSPKS